MGPRGRWSMGFSRAISAATVKAIRSYTRAFGGALPPGLDHDGVEDAFLGKASSILYFDGKRWRGLRGMD